VARCSLCSGCCRGFGLPLVYLVDIPGLSTGSSAERTTLASLDPAELHRDDPEIHAAYSRALYPAYFADRELGRMFAPPRALSATGAAVAARLRRDGYDWRSAIRAIRATTLLVHGRDDILPAALATETATLIAGAKTALIADAGHMPFWEQPSEFFNVVESVLAAPGRRRGLHVRVCGD